jgi:hydrogenase-4 component H
MYLPKLREVKEALYSFFTAPYTTKFPKTAYQPHEAYRGKPRYNEDYCVGCGTCAQVCPSKAITIDDDLDKLKRTLTVEYASCMQCGQCEEHCITEKGIQLTTEFSQATMDLNAPHMFESVQKNIAVCEVSGEFIACRDHLQWVKEKLGHKAYAHPNFMLLTQEKFFKLEPSYPKDRLRREDQIKRVTPKVRYKIVVEDEFK